MIYGGTFLKAGDKVFCIINNIGLRDIDGEKSNDKKNGGEDKSLVNFISAKGVNGCKH